MATKEPNGDQKRNSAPSAARSTDTRKTASSTRKTAPYPRAPAGTRKKSKREAWETQPGHDPKIHIAFDDAITLFDLQRHLKLTDDATVKGFLDREFEIQHRYSIRQDQFQACWMRCGSSLKSGGNQRP